MLYPSFISPYHAEYVHWPIISQAWALSFELLFYITFIMFIINSKLGLFTYTFWFFCIIVNFFKLLTPSNFLLKFLLNPMIILFFMGMSLAYLVMHYDTYLKKFYTLFLSTGIVGLLITWIFTCYGYIGFYKVHRLFTYSIPYSLIILGFVLWERVNVKDIKGGKLFSFGVLLGDASYSIYLMHFLTLSIIYHFLRLFHLTKINESLAYVVASGITIIIGLGCYHLFEKPLSWKMRRIFLSENIISG